MKLSPLFPCLGVAVFLAWLPAPAQTADDTDAETPPPGATLIMSDELHADQSTHISIFTGNVVTVGTNFKMSCQEMTVYFTNDNKVDRIVATGDVVITQPNRVTHCGHAEYFHDDDKFVLTDRPVILDGKNTLSGTEIIIFRATQKLITPGGKGRTRVVLGPGSLGSSKPAQPSADTAPSSVDTK